MTIDLHSLTNDEAAWQMLAAYEAADHDYELWATMVGLTPGSGEAARAYTVVHEGYARLWLDMGDMFHVKLWPLAEAWRERLPRRKARGGLATIARAFARAT